MTLIIYEKLKETSLLIEELPRLKRFHYDPLSRWIHCETYDGLLYRYFLPPNHYWRRFADGGKKQLS